MEKIDWQEITEELGEDRWRDDLVVIPRQSRLLLAKLVQENRFLSRDSQQIYYGPDSQIELYEAAKTAYNSLVNPLQTEFIDMVINGDLVVNNDDLVVDESTGSVSMAGTVTGGNIRSRGHVESYASIPVFRGYETDAGTDQKYLEIRQEAGAVRMRFVNDAYSAASNFMTIARDSGTYTVANVTFPTGGVIVGAPTGGAKGTGTINLPDSYYVNGLNVLGARKTGWSAPTGTLSRATFSTSTVTLESLAQRLKALIDDLIGHGLIGG